MNSGKAKMRLDKWIVTCNDNSWKGIENKNETGTEEGQWVLVGESGRNRLNTLISQFMSSV
jgi:hypothetical protein